MATILTYDQSGLVTGYFPSAHTPDFSGIATKLIDPNMAAVTAVQQEFWIVDGGSVREMTEQEKETFYPETPAQVAQAELDAGFPVTPEGFSLGCTELDRENWHTMRDHFWDKLDRGVIEDTETVTLKDINGQVRQMTFARFREVVSALGDWYMQRWFIIHS